MRRELTGRVHGDAESSSVGAIPGDYPVGIVLVPVVLLDSLPRLRAVEVDRRAHRHVVLGVPVGLEGGYK